MAKIKKISINAFEKAVKEYHENTIVAEWNGLEITITHTKDTPSSAHIVCIWDDEYGDSRKYKQKFNFYS